MDDEGFIWLLILLGLGVVFLALGLLLLKTVADLAIGLIWGGAIILGGFLLGICMS